MQVKVRINVGGKINLCGIDAASSAILKAGINLCIATGQLMQTLMILEEWGANSSIATTPDRRSLESGLVHDDRQYEFGVSTQECHMLYWRPRG